MVEPSKSDDDEFYDEFESLLTSSGKVSTENSLATSSASLSLPKSSEATDSKVDGLVGSGDSASILADITKCLDEYDEVSHPNI